MARRFYYEENNNETFLNTLYSADIALEKHFSGILFEGDLDRVVYASNQYAFRKRSQMMEQDYSNVDFPFMNYQNDFSINFDTERYYHKHTNQVQGMYLPDLGRKVRIVPQRIDYEASIWFGSAFDLQVAMARIANDNSNETILTIPVTTTDGFEIEVAGFLGYDFSSNEYEQEDWLEENKIFNQGINPSLDVLFMYDDQGPVSITEEIILNFVESKNLNKSDPINSDPKSLLIEYFS